MKLRRCLALLAFAAVFMSGPGYAKSLRFASGYPPNSVAEQAAQKYTQVLKDETDGALSARVFSLTLLNLLESSAGVRDGMADAAVVLFPYFPGSIRVSTCWRRSPCCSTPVVKILPTRG